MTTTLRQDAAELTAAIESTDREFSAPIKRKRLIEARDKAQTIVRKIDRDLGL